MASHEPKEGGMDISTQEEDFGLFITWSIRIGVVCAVVIFGLYACAT